MFVGKNSGGGSSYITFDEPFETTPTVYVLSTGGNNQGWGCVGCHATNVSRTGFTASTSIRADLGGYTAYHQFNWLAVVFD